MYYMHTNTNKHYFNLEIPPVSTYKYNKLNLHNSNSMCQLVVMWFLHGSYDDTWVVIQFLYSSCDNVFTDSYKNVSTGCYVVLTWFL